jgi:hypothetical protein
MEVAKLCCNILDSRTRALVIVTRIKIGLLPCHIAGHVMYELPPDRYIAHSRLHRILLLATQLARCLTVATNAILAIRHAYDHFAVVDFWCRVDSME